MKPLPYEYDDGGRKASGFKGDAGDCVCRAIAIATGEEYRTVYDELHEAGHWYGKGHRGRVAKKLQKNPSVRDGCFREVYEPYLLSRGWVWVPTMGIGTGCTVHLAEGELPQGRIIARVSKHLCAVVDGVLRDTQDPSRGGNRCVYGYFHKP